MKRANETLDLLVAGETVRQDKIEWALQVRVRMLRLHCLRGCRRVRAVHEPPQRGARLCVDASSCACVHSSCRCLCTPQTMFDRDAEFHSSVLALLPDAAEHLAQQPGRVGPYLAARLKELGLGTQEASWAA